MTPEIDIVVRPAEVARRLGIARSTLYLWEKNEPGFPARLKLGKRAAGWRWRDIEQWLEGRALEGRDRAPR